MSQTREIVIDTETTGLSIKDGHKIIELGCVEIVDKVPTGNYFHSYFNPKRSVDKGAFAIHGIGDDFLSDKPLFANTIIDFLKFIGNSPLIIHNAAFDMQFINAELGYAGYPLISHTKVIDTLQMARKKFPGSPASLDALCKRFSISLSGRDKHGALIDAELLALVYIQLTGGTQGQIAFMEGEKEKIVNALIIERKIRHFNITELEKLQHQEMIQKLKNPIWLEE